MFGLKLAVSSLGDLGLCSSTGGIFCGQQAIFKSSVAGDAKSQFCRIASPGRHVTDRDVAVTRTAQGIFGMILRVADRRVAGKGVHPRHFFRSWSCVLPALEQAL